MAKFFETMIKNLEKSIPPRVTSRNNRKCKKDYKKRKVVFLNNFEDEDIDQGQKGKKNHIMCRHTTDQCTTLKTLVKQTKQKKSKHFGKKKRFAKHEVNAMV